MSTLENEKFEENKKEAEEERTKICLTCFRELPETDMKKFFGGEISSMCKTCDSIIGKGAGYGDNESEKFSEDWFNRSYERKEQLKKEGKL